MVLESLNLTEVQLKSFVEVRKLLSAYFLAKKSTIYGRFIFNTRCQRPEEPLDVFITDIDKLLENCNYGCKYWVEDMTGISRGVSEDF